jgi:DNA-binding transcriptional LysR family regulator
MRDWDEHRLVLAIHRGGTLRAAADELGVTHTTVSRRLASLEDGQAAPIFNRIDRAYKVSEYGRQRVVIAEQIEALDYAARRLERGASDGLSGPLSLSVPQAFLQFVLMEDIAAFAAAHPDIQLTVAGSDTFADLDRGQADVVVRGQINPDPHLVGRMMSTVGLNYYANRDYLATTEPGALQWISNATEPHSGAGHVPDWLSQSPFPHAPVGLVIGDIVSRYQAVASGLGLGRLACFMADPDPRLIRVCSAKPQQFYELWVLTHPDLRETPKVRALMRWLGDALKPKRERLTGIEVD